MSAPKLRNWNGVVFDGTQYTEVTQGEGGGLDADKLDGYHAAQLGGGGGLSYTEKMEEITPSATGWQTYSLSGYGVPANAICEFVLSNSDIGLEREAGIRAKNSALERRFDLQEAEAGGRTFVTVHVKADVNSQVEGYAEDTNDVRFILVGYWS